MSKKIKDKGLRDSLIAMPDPLFDIGLFRNPQIAKLVLSRVAADAFREFGDSNEMLKKFDEFISGRVQPKFDPEAKMWGMLPDITNGITYWIVPVKKKLTEKEEIEQSKILSKELLTIGPDTSIRSLCRFFMLSNEETRNKYLADAEEELEEQNKKGNKKKNNWVY